MKTKILLLFIIILVIVSLFTGFSSNRVESLKNTSDFSSYWYDGKAELTSYSLVQNRYGELHKGHAVMVYVSEDFSKKLLSNNPKLVETPIKKWCLC